MLPFVQPDSEVKAVMSGATFHGDVAQMRTAAELLRRGDIVSRPLTNVRKGGLCR